MIPQDTPSAPSVAVSQTSQSEARRIETAEAATPASSSHSLHGQQEEKVKAVGNYILTGNTLGKGNFARVELASHCLTGAKVAVKIIQTDKIKEEYVRRNLFRESAIMRRLQHPNIVRLYETIKTSRMLCLVTDCAEGGELLQHVKNATDRKLSEEEGRVFMRQLVSAIHYMHNKGIVHRDLKMENILLDKHKRKILIIDFGLSNKLEGDEMLATHCGSPEYAAPELFVPGKVYGAEVDVWSLGVNMFAMLAGKLPFRVPRQGGNRRRRLLDQITVGIGPQQESESSHFSDGAMDLVRLLLQPNSDLRITLLGVMKHPWITKNALYPLHPYFEQDYDPNVRDRIMDLMCARLDVTHSQINRSVSESRCDWLYAIYHLLHDQPDGLGNLRDISRQEACRLTCSQGQTSSQLSTSQPSTEGGNLKQSRGHDVSNNHADVAEVPAVPSSINAVMRQLEAAAGKPLTQTRVTRRHSEGARPRPFIKSSQSAKEQDEQTEKAVHGANLPIPSGRSSFRSRFSRSRRSASTEKSSENDTEVVGSPIRSAMLNRGRKTGEQPRRHSVDQGVITSSRHSSEPTAHQIQRPSSAGSRYERRQSLPAEIVTTKSGSKESSPSIERSTKDDGESGKKKLSLRWRQSPRKQSKMKRPKSSEDIPSLVHSPARTQGMSSLGFAAAASAGSSSLSRSFELKPRAMSAFAQQSLTLQPHHLNGHADFFSQPLPQYDLNMPWAGPIFTGYAMHGSEHRRPALQRTHRGNRAKTSSMADALTAYPAAYLQAVPMTSDYTESSVRNGDVAQKPYQQADSALHHSSGERPRRPSSGTIGGMLRRSFRTKT